MNTTSFEWLADEYAIGSYIQSSIADQYLTTLPIQSGDHVLDVGCGDGHYTLKILEQFSAISLLGIDASKNMVECAKNQVKHFPKANFAQISVTEMAFDSLFDVIVSFWCLQWVPDTLLAFTKMHAALKTGGKLFALFPSGDDGYIGSYRKVKALKQFAALEAFIPPIDYTKFDNLEKKLKTIGFRRLAVHRNPHRLRLPSLAVFEKFIKPIPFFEGQIPPDEIKQIQAAMVNSFFKECQQRYNGEYYFDLTVYVVEAEK